MTNTNSDAYWSKRYEENRTGWDIGFPSRPLKQYIDQLKNKDLKILIPGAGNAYEAAYLFEKGFQQVFVLDISRKPLDAFKNRQPDFPEQQLLHGDFFEQQGQYDLILEQTFFCAFEPTVKNRSRYASKMNELLSPNGKLVGLWFNHPLVEEAKRPFGGSKMEYLSYLKPFFHVEQFEDCYNSIEARQGKEWFGIFLKR